MCSIRTKHRLHNTNRVIIAGLTVIGLLMDGFQSSDIIFGASIVIWIWLPECVKLEAMTLDRLSTTNNAKQCHRSSLIDK